MAETKAYQTFRGESDWLNVALQLMDVSIRQSANVLSREYYRGDKTRNIALTLSSDLHLHPQLNHQVRHFTSVVGQTRNKLTEFAMNYLYVLWTNYLHSVLKEMIKKNAATITILSAIDDTSTLNGIGLWELTDLNNSIKIRKTVVKKVYEIIENIPSSRKLMDSLISYTNINIPQDVKNDALYYLDIRNLFVHNRGIMDRSFVNKHHVRHPDWRAGNKIPRSYQLYTEMYDAIKKLCLTIDRKLVQGHFVNSH